MEPMIPDHIPKLEFDGALAALESEGLESAVRCKILME